MKLNDMLFVIARRKDAETNMLMTFGEYRERVLYYWCQSMEGAARHIEEILTGRQDKDSWAAIDHGKDYGYDVRFCLGEQDLKDFLHGHFNSRPEWYLDVDRCSDACLRALGEYNIDRNGVSMGDTYRYEEREHTFERGGLLQDFNGTGYRVMEYYNQDMVLRKFCEKTHSLPAKTGVRMRNQSDMQVIEEQMKGAVIRSRIPSWNTMSGELTEAFYRMAVGEITPEQAAACLRSEDEN